MSKIRSILTLYYQGKSKSFISNYLSISRNTVKKYINVSHIVGLDATLLDTKTDLELQGLIVERESQALTPRQQTAYEFFPQMEKQLKRKGVTKELMWRKYKERHPNGLQSSAFMEHYMRWSRKVNPVMHIVHKAGDKMYVDYAGKTLQLIDATTGEVKEVEFFVAILGASQKTYAEATYTQGKKDFIASVQRALRYFGGVPQAIVPDNLKSAVTKSSRFEPLINETFLELAAHYETTILPARAYKPKDKSLVEGAVKILYNRIYTQLYGQQFFELPALNKAIGKALEDHNNRPLTGRSHSRSDLFEEIEKKELRPLPQSNYQIKEQAQATIMTNGHAFLSKDKHYYSVPFQFIKKKVKLLYDADTVEIYHKYNRIAIHKRNYKRYEYTTLPDHLASTHKFVTEWSPQRFTQWAESIDVSVKEYICKVLEKRQHPEQSYKSCMGILSMVKDEKVGKQRLINACKKALHFDTYSYQIIKNILDRELDKVVEDDQYGQLPLHVNIRGKDYYQ